MVTETPRQRPLSCDESVSVSTRPTRAPHAGGGPEEQTTPHTTTRGSGVARRAFLATAGALGVAGLAGCLGGTPGSQRQQGRVNSVDDAQPAVIQIISKGSFVYPDSGARVNQQGAGSGFIIDPSGIAVTNNHVVTGAATLEVFVGGDTTRSYNARILGVSECSDLAVIEISSEEEFRYFEWFDGQVAPNLDVWALGFPLGDPNYTVTRGIVSKANAPGDSNWASVDSVIEHDARIRGGNSGGPLVEEGGRVVGVNYAGNDQFDQNFAIGAGLAQRLVDTLRTDRDVTSIGINGQSVISGDGSSGIWVVSVESGSPAWNAGIRPGDWILRMENLVLATDNTMKDYCDILRSRSSDDVLTVQVLRLSTGELLTGDINGKPLAPVVANLPAGPGGGQSGTGGGGTSAGYASYRSITDSTGALRMEVPTEWADVSGQSIDFGPALVASPNIDGFVNSFTTPGVLLVASTSLGSDADALLDQLAFPDCTDLGRDQYDDGYHAGRFQLFDACGGTPSGIVNIVAFPPDRAYTMVLQTQVVERRDLDALARVIGSVRIDSQRLS